MRILLTITVFLSMTAVSCTSKPSSGIPDEQTIRGTVTLSAELQKTLKPTAALYIITRKLGEPHGPPVAVKKIGPPLKFPVDFELSPRDVMMMHDRRFEGNLGMSARIAQSGAATPTNPGDIEGFPPGHMVPVGAQGIEIKMDEVRR